MKTVYFSHGKESGPNGSKIQALSRIAQQKGWAVESIDYTSTMDPDKRVTMLLDQFGELPSKLVLVGSSMGGYVSTVASETLKPAGLFLMAPAFYLQGYGEQDPRPCAKHSLIVHGWKDDIVPPENVISFAQKHLVELALIDAGHTLVEGMERVEGLFGEFLDRVG